MLEINALSDDVLRLILQTLPVRELIRLKPLICTRWKLLIGQIMLTTTELHFYEFRHEVKAVNRAISERNFDIRLDETVLLLNKTDPEGFDPSKALLLPTLFPNVKVFGFSFKESIESKIPLLIDQWSANLTVLIMSELPKSEETLQQFWKTLVTLSKLTNLTFIRTFRHPIPSAIYPILNQLTNFSLVHYLSDLVPILSQLTTIKELSIHWVYLSAEQMAKAIEQNSNLKQLEMLYIGFIFSQNGDREKNYQHLFWFICQNFKALKKLDNQYGDQLDLSDIIHGLSELTSLAELWIYVGRHQLKQADLSSLPQLHSVKILRLEIFELTVEQFFTFTSRTFPNLEQLILRAPDFDATQQKTVLSRLSEAFPNLKMKKIKFA